MSRSYKSKFTEEQFRAAVRNAISIRGALLNLGMASTAGGYYQLFHQKVNQYNIDLSHFLGQGHNKGKTWQSSIRRPIEEICVENSPYTSIPHLRKRLIKEGFLEARCVWCGISDWREMPLSLQLDHINGIRTDNRLENLRILCPNCHTQTSTYSGKNIKYGVRKQHDHPKRRTLRTPSSPRKPRTPLMKDWEDFCTACGVEIIKRTKTKLCQPCSVAARVAARGWPSVTEMTKLVWEIPARLLGPKLGVSDVAITKFCKRHNIPKPGLGYWRKKETGKL